MSGEQWKGLKAGDYIRMKSGLPRKISEVKNGSIVLPSHRSRNGSYTVYCLGDKYLFQRVILKPKTKDK